MALSTTNVKRYGCFCELGVLIVGLFITSNKSVAILRLVMGPCFFESSHIGGHIAVLLRYPFLE